MTVAHGRLKPVRMQLPQRKHLVCPLPNPEQSEHWQECRNGEQNGGELTVIGSRTKPVMHAEAAVRPSNQDDGDLPPPPERNEGKVDGEYHVVAARDVKG